MRFPGFDGEWEQKKLGEIADKITDGTHDTPKPIEVGVPFLTAIHIKNGFIDYENCYYLEQEVHNHIYKRCNPEKGDLLIVNIGAGTGNCALNTVNYEFSLKNVALVKVSKNIIDGCFLFQVQIKNSSKIFTKLAAGGAQPFLSLKEIGRLKIVFPSLVEQQKIASFLALIDERIATQNKIIEQLETLIKGLCQNLANNKQWEKQYLRNILTERKETNKDNLPIFSVSVSKGVINQIEYLGRSFASKNITNYNVVHFGDVVYTKSPTGEFPYGIIKQSFISENVAVSPLYGVYEPKNVCIGNILHYYFNSPINANNYLHSLVQKGAKNTINITNQRFLDNTIFLPTDEKEVENIASLLNNIDQKIQTEKAILTQFENQKKYLLNQMFV
ncbi:restriction endonuclease subunit S [Myroides odoratimimus]|uniref:restriction endonuclease subunit S n=1 Tax=Myroides odoratimimus TaxID=76832 RepID=UPI002DB5E0CD|nr:restriction endonuclease subunit S [Myroides odoratimimus]MEC4034310.1 restriction endonuclease subunit S [Myroides odoratimimus]